MLTVVRAECDAAASVRTRSLCRSPSSSGSRRRQDSLSLSLVIFPTENWVSAGLAWGWVSLPSGRCGCVGRTPRGVYFGEKRFSCGALRRRTHVVLFRRFLCGGGITTLGVRFMPLDGRSYGGVFVVLRHPSPLTAHSGSHAETRRVLRVDGDDVSGSGIIDTIDPFQADQTVAVALAEGHRNAVSP